MFIDTSAFRRQTTGQAGPSVVTSIVFPRVENVTVTASANIAAGAATATTAQLTAPSGKTSGADFQAGKISDDTNALSIPPIDLAAGKYTELEWALTTAGLVNGDVVEFRVTAFGVPLDTYSVTPQWTIGTAGAAALFRRTLFGKAGSRSFMG